MLSYAVKRILWIVPVLLAVSIITFTVMHAAPGSPWNREGRQLDPDLVARLNDELGLDKPLPFQYLAWVGSVVRGDFGISTSTTLNPVNDIIVWQEYMRLTFGIEANTMAIPISVINKLKISPNLIDRIKYGGTMDRPTEVTLDQIKMLFGIERLFVPKAVYNTAGENLTPSYSYIWSNTMWMGYVAPAPTMETPSAMYNFAWTGDTTAGLPVGMAAGAGPQAWDATRDPRVAGLFMRRYRENRPSGEFVESELYISTNVTAPSMGMTFTTPITP